MCVTVGPARLANTIIYIGEAEHPQHGLVRVLGYQNKPSSLSGPNAMLLHFPAKNQMGQESIIDVSDYPEFLKDLRSYMTPRSRGLMKSATGLPPGVTIFDTGIYTVVMASKPSLIPEALEQIEERKRPPIRPSLFDWYEETLPNFQVAVCCFDNEDYSKAAAPLFWWYNPRHETVLMAPGVDAHDGGTPNLQSRVEVDSFVIAGSHRAPLGGGVHRVMDHMPEAFKPFAPKGITAKAFEGILPNSDYLVDKNFEAGLSVRRGVLLLP